jgi:type VI secretion system protein ImpK
MAGSGAVRDYWATRSLQLSLFAENVAGERFFEHLESVRSRPQQVDVLRVYYLCLLFGFRGRYGVRAAEVTISDLLDSVRTQLFSALRMPEALSPNGARPEDGLTDSVQRLPVLAVSVAVVALAGALYLGLWLSLADQLQQFVAWTQQAGGRV